MKTITLEHYVSYVRLTGLVLCATLLLFACSKKTEGPEDPGAPDSTDTQLILNVSAADIDVGEEVTFTITAGGNEIDADIYIDNQKINDKKHVFSNSGNYEIVARKDKYKESDKTLVEVYTLDIYVSGLQNITSNDVSATQVFVWKNGEVLHELTDGTAFASTAGIALHNDDVYIGGVESAGNNRVAKYWKNNIEHILDKGTTSTWVADIAVDKTGNVYVIGTHNDPHKAVLWRNNAIQAVSITTDSRYARAITTSGDDIYIAGNSASYANNRSVAILWKNDQEIHLTNGTKSGRALKVAVNDGDIYVMGDENSNETGGKQIGRYWKNGTTTLLDENPAATVGLVGGDIAVQDGDVYVCGLLIDGTTTHSRAVVWKNGKRLHELTDGTSHGSASDIAVSDKHIYTVGQEANSKGKPVIKVWKDGEVLYQLTDGVRRADAGGIAIKRSK